MKSKRDSVFGASKVEAVDATAKVSAPAALSNKQIKQDKEEKAASDMEAEENTVATLKAKSATLNKSEDSCPSEKKEAKEEADKAEKAAETKAATAKEVQKQEAAQEKYEKKVASEEAATAKAAKVEAAKEDEKAKVDAAEYNAENAAAKIPKDKKSLTAVETWTVSDLGGSMNLS